jgi:hypothetical protein
MVKTLIFSVILVAVILLSWYGEVHKNKKKGEKE